MDGRRVVRWAALARQRRGRAAVGVRRKRASRCEAFPAVLAAPARGRARCVRCAHCARTTATSQLTKRAARAARAAALLGASHARRQPPGRAFAEPGLALVEKSALWPSRRAVPGGGAVGGGEQRRIEVGAHSALRDLTRRGCSSAVSTANGASSAARPRAEQRSAVGAQRRPPPSAPPPGTARRDTPIGAHSKSSRPRCGG